METVRVTTRPDGVSVVEFNRPSKRNAFTQAMIDDFTSKLSALDQDTSVRAVVVTGSPGGPFSAGVDLKELVQISEAEAHERKFLRDLTDALTAFSKPIIAAVVGFALGGGFEVALLCDIIYAADNALLGLPEIRIGTIPGAGGTQHLTALLGKHKAMEFILTGASATAQELERLGLVNRTFPADRVLDEALQLAARIASMSSAVAKLAKRSVLNASENLLSAGMDREKELYYASFSTHDCKEGMTAFLEKRPPKFEHR
ncbi:Crotonase core [Lasiodiplodia theobromae]|uniref:Enoyl-CoA hydratase n=1 Tax=Lasiodiplodia theobromae TaxID=45133 RepID=A0A5N5DB78_9PEZI|nr:Crotonase core [Lasiodiplodia theobromae]KAB2574660.1 Enoyl-CoA hydratase [Lasiodiplodia theobromae]KAF4545954.1 Crotonase core [Lasiodiplodia theobromae]KAF9635017.1 Crotonase core [Lasiodiplodia theobromae]